MISMSLLFVHMSVSISQEIHARSSPIFVHVTYGHDSVLLRQHCSMLCTYDFMDDIKLVHNSQE